jgi:hypothetical protein
MSSVLAAFTPYVSLWVAQTQVLPDVEVLLDRHHQGCWGEASPEQQRANQRNLRRQRGRVVSMLYSARNHRLRFVSDFATKQTLVRLDETTGTGGS